MLANAQFKVNSWLLKRDIVVCYCPQELVEEDIDWWSKYYASIGDYDKSGDYIERGYDKLIVRLLMLFTYLAARCSVNVFFFRKSKLVMTHNY